MHNIVLRFVYPSKSVRSSEETWREALDGDFQMIFFPMTGLTNSILNFLKSRSIETKKIGLKQTKNLHA